MVVALHVAAHAAPPRQTVSRATRLVQADLIGTRATDGLCRMAQHLLQARTFRSFETYFVVTLIYLALSMAIRRLFVMGGRRVLGAGVS
ncbi:hypothetical protein D3C87_1625230 [compost metagenome]